PSVIRTLFLKIFIVFWLTMALTIGVFYLMFRIANAESLPERATRGAFGESLTLFAESTVRIFEREGQQALDQYVRRAFKESGTETFLFDSQGHPLTSDNVDGAIANVVQQVVDNPQQATPPRPFPLFYRGVTRATWARPVVSPNGKHYIFVVRFRQPAGPPGFLTPSRIG